MNDEIHTLKAPLAVFARAVRKDELTEQIINMQQSSVEGQAGHIFEAIQFFNRGEMSEVFRVLTEANVKSSNTIECLNVMIFERNQLIKNIQKEMEVAVEEHKRVHGEEETAAVEPPPPSEVPPGTKVH